MKTGNNGTTGEQARERPDGLQDSFRDQSDCLPPISVEDVRAALEQVATVLRCHNTDGTARLKRFVWFLWNGDHSVNLYDLGRVLDATNSWAVATVFMAYMNCMLSEEHLRWLLVNS